MRLFIAFDLPKKMIEKIGEFRDQIGDEAAKIKWVEPENLHLTLKFLGEIEDKKAKEVVSALKNVKFKPFLTSTAEIGVFPAEKYIRVIWIGLKPQEKIEDLHIRIDQELSKIGFKKEERFQAHITLGRVKFVKNRDLLLSALKTLKPEDISEPFTVKCFKLKKSTLALKGPIYEDIETYNF